MGMSVREMLDATFTKPFGIQPSRPELGVVGIVSLWIRSTLLGRLGSMILPLGPLSLLGRRICLCLTSWFKRQADTRVAR